MFIDTHCHFDAPPFIKHEDDTIATFKQYQVEKIIVPAVGNQNFSIVKSLSQQYAPIYYALGLHPIFKHNPSDLIILDEMLKNRPDKLVAIGETGLDNFIESANLKEQQSYLLQQFELANHHQLPIILHSRRTHAQILMLLKQNRLINGGVIHGFSGSYEQAMQFIRLGFYIGVGGVISYERAKKTRHAISKIPLEFIVLETDAPDMPLSGLQGQPNRPENIVRVFDILVSLRSEPAEKIKNSIIMNTLTLFPRINKMKDN
ncbi:TatD family hydrolase [Frischella perrara]|uniref:TatD family hydrolase n=1 Tax=Frischella perrara TaxID=1267021 RepID=UPI0023F03215|nr:TatD family hydrolase [Frischella perrara]